MSEYPKITIIIPHRKNDSLESALEQIALLDYPKEKIELFTVTGNHPSVQRNACIKEATGEIIYFLDNDSEVEPRNIIAALEVFARDEKIAVVGGPNLPKATDSFLQNEFSYCLSSRVCVGPVANRYKSYGKLRRATEKELILCNLFIKKKVLDEVGLFNTELYPNEENELMGRIEEAGYIMMYHPGLKVHRSPRPDLRSFVRMLLSYGAGRLKHMAISFRLNNLAFLLPAGFSVYMLLYFPVLAFSSDPLFIQIISFPVLLYIILMFGFSSLSFYRFREKKHRAFFTIPFLFFSVHFFYGLGIILGAVRRIYAGGKTPEIFYEVEKKEIH